jgi:hypothetical protein
VAVWGKKRDLFFGVHQPLAQHRAPQQDSAKRVQGHESLEPFFGLESIESPLARAAR